MKRSRWSKGVVLALTFSASLAAAVAPAFAAESTMPSPPYTDVVSPVLAEKYTYTEDGDYTKELDIPTYEWMPAGTPPKVMILGIHGLTLHGRRFRVLARALAINGAGFVALDMRGFGRCHFDKEFSSKIPGEKSNEKPNPGNRNPEPEDKTKIDHEASYQDILKLSKLIKQKYPDVPLIALGESLGCTFCVRLAADNPDVSAIVLSAPAVKVNKDMYAGKGQIVQGVKAVLTPSHEMDLKSFFADLCSAREDVQKEMLDDPMVLKKLKLKALLSTDAFVDKTARYGKLTSPNLAVLILQGSADGCVSPTRVTELMNTMPSTDQTLDWRGKFGHLQLETRYMRAQTVSAIANWLSVHSKDRLPRLQELNQQIIDLGGTITN